MHSRITLTDNIFSCIAFNHQLEVIICYTIKVIIEVVSDNLSICMYVGQSESSSS